MSLPNFAGGRDPPPFMAVRLEENRHRHVQGDSISGNKSSVPFFNRAGVPAV
jgi:hypothetical protein